MNKMPSRQPSLRWDATQTPIKPDTLWVPIRVVAGAPTGTEAVDKAKGVVETLRAAGDVPLFRAGSSSVVNEGSGMIGKTRLARATVTFAVGASLSDDEDLWARVGKAEALRDRLFDAVGRSTVDIGAATWSVESYDGQLNQAVAGFVAQARAQAEAAGLSIAHIELAPGATIDVVGPELALLKPHASVRFSM